MADKIIYDKLTGIVEVKPSLTPAVQPATQFIRGDVLLANLNIQKKIAQQNVDNYLAQVKDLDIKIKSLTDQMKQ